MESADIKDVETAIKAVTNERFPDGGIVSVRVLRDKDFEGDPILRITIVFDPANPLDSKRTVSLIRHLRSRLAEIGEISFPVISYISKAEIGKRKPAAA